MPAELDGLLALATHLPQVYDHYAILTLVDVEQQTPRRR